VQGLKPAITAKTGVMLGLWGLGAGSCVLGLAAPPPHGPHHGVGEQVLDLLRVLCATALVIVLLLGPGVAWRARRGQDRMALGFLPLPGLALLAATGGLAWALAGDIEPWVTSLAVLAPVMAWLLWVLIRQPSEDLLSWEEGWVLLIVGCVLGFTIARSLWSPGPSGELYGGTVSRTLEVGNRSDSRIPFVIVQLVGHGTTPYSPLAASYFAPYDFSSRGPLEGLAAAPVVLAAGGRPPVELPNQTWAPFDRQGFMAYRLAMMAFACTAFLSLWTLVRKLGSSGAARLALLLGATTPFLVHEVWFTWPKLLASSLVILAAICIIERRPLAGGLLTGFGYLVHPVALVSLPILAMLALWPLVGARLKRPHVRSAVLVLAGAAVCVLAWRLVNGSHYTQSGFADYLAHAGFNFDPTAWEWVSFRFMSVGNTLVPLMLVFASAHDSYINVFGGISPASIHFFFQYWTGVPFGAAIVFFPLLLIALWRAARRWRWPVFVAVIAPFAAFAVYWGASKTGMLREGLQAWMLAVLAVVALEQSAEGFSWLRSAPLRAVLALRSFELLVLALGPTIATGRLIIWDFALVDIVALAAMVGFSAALAAALWRERAPEPPPEAERPQAAAPSLARSSVG
jgi:hypothetical protein